MLKKLGKTLTNNFGLKILAILFAMILWLVVVNIDDPTRTKPFSKCWCLDTTTGKLGIIFAGQCASGINADHPIRFCTSHCCMVKRFIIFTRFEVGESIANRFVCNRRNPESLQRFSIVCFFQNPSCNQLSFATGIGGNDDITDIFAIDQILDRMELFAGLFNDDQFPVFREHRERVHTPSLIFYT